MQFINKAYLLIGGNVGDMFIHLDQAISKLNKRCGEIINKSSIYKTAAWGITDQAPFLNQAVLLQSTLNAEELMAEILKVEEDMGRKRGIRYGPRTIDIDILLFNSEIINKPTLIVPHPQMQDRLFALAPLAEIAGGYIHPTLNKTIETLKKECKDELSVEKLVSPGLMG